MTEKQKKIDDNPCPWTGDGYGNWDTGCGEMFEFLTGGPDDVGMVYCPYCGKKIEVKKGSVIEEAIDIVEDKSKLIITVNGKKLEVADSEMEFKENWHEAIARAKSIGEGWRLPDKDELTEMYLQLHKKGLGGFSGSWYWSSSENDYYNAWGQNFGDGYQHYYYGNHSGRVRAVREL